MSCIFWTHQSTSVCSLSQKHSPILDYIYNWNVQKITFKLLWMFKCQKLKTHIRFLDSYNWFWMRFFMTSFKVPKSYSTSVPRVKNILVHVLLEWQIQTPCFVCLSWWNTRTIYHLIHQVLHFLTQFTDRISNVRRKVIRIIIHKYQNDMLCCLKKTRFFCRMDNLYIQQI